MSIISTQMSSSIKNGSWIRRMFEAGIQLKQKYGDDKGQVGEGLLPARVQAPSPAPDVAVTEENTALTDAPSHSTERVTCNLCLDPHCPRQKGDPRSQCLHAGKRGDA